MSVTAKLRYLRIAPRKVRLVISLILGKSAEEAQAILNFTTKSAAKPLLKLLKSAIANAKHDFQIDQANLYISEIRADEGPKYKRWRPRARGRANQIQKRTSHITIVLDEIKKRPEDVKKAKKAVKVPEKVEKVERIPKKEKPKPKPEVEVPRPKVERGIKRIFKRKSF